MLPGSSLQVHVPSADVSPQTVFGSLDPKGLAALQAAFHDNFADAGRNPKVSCAGAEPCADASRSCWPVLHVCHTLCATWCRQGIVSFPAVAGSPGSNVLLSSSWNRP